MQKTSNLTRAQLVETITEWRDFRGPANVRGQVGITTRNVHEPATAVPPVWITRVPNPERPDGYTYTIYDGAAWNAVSTALEFHGSRELAHAE